MEKKRMTTAILRQRKEAGVPLAMLTAYDYSMATLLDEAGVDMILVGDSLGNVVLGYDSTLPVTMEDMIHHGKAVCRGVKQAFVVIDMPFLSYQISPEDALGNAGRIMKETGAQAVKMEGGKEILPAVEKIISAGIPVVAHLGLTPQHVHQLGGFKVQGKETAAAQRIFEDARLLERAGVCAITLECVPQQLAEKISRTVKIPVIGIGAGAGCDGQVLVIYDMLGIHTGFVPKFVRQFANLKEQISRAVGAYKSAVQEKTFPAAEHSFQMSDEVLEKLY